jgi:phosphoesterase RecJ-like protein
MPIHEAEFRRLANLVETWKRPLLLTHVRPDGDAIGCMLALQSMLRGRGAAPYAVFFDPLPARYSFLYGENVPTVEPEPVRTIETFGPDGVVILDTCAYAQLKPVADWLRSNDLQKVAIDHHLTRDDLADEYLIDTDASAAALILHDWGAAAGWTVDAIAAEALFVGIATDTGWFSYANTDASTLDAAAQLVARGVVPNRLHERLYQTETAGRVRLAATAVATLELHDEGRVAIMALAPRDFEACGAERSDTTDIVNRGLRIEGVLASVLLVVQDSGEVRASLRSRAPSPGRAAIDVARLATELGGGGHARAAGARLPGPLAEAKRHILDLLIAAGKTAGGKA